MAKIPQYNAKKTVAVTEQVLRSWCGVSNAYLWNVENGQRRIAELEGGLASGSSRNEGTSEQMRGEQQWWETQRTRWYSIVLHDNLMYGMEMSLKAAQMIDGYHGLNRDVGIPGFIDNFEDFGGLTYVYVYPTHRLDRIYREFMSPAMRRALENVLPLKEYLDFIYSFFYPDQLREHWAPGEDHPKGAGDVLHDSVRYTGHWITHRWDARLVMRIVQSFRRLNGILPGWFYDAELKPRPRKGA